ncbi:hypothetical protein [Xanthomonas citri]|uniref:hypothetical protein n=1 Tax=Xanthomonas citri TaxID=346 RepID=UPI001E2D6263|nr:hypothetical protein [Xanthomonas citri]
MPDISEIFMLLKNVLGCFFAFGLLILVACQQEAPSGKESKAVNEERSDTQKSGSESLPQAKNSKGVARVTTLYQVVLLFVAKNDASWSSFDTVTGVQWRENYPQPNPDTTSPENSRSRSGTIRLDGFGMVDVPDGNQGADAGVKSINEGESGLTLQGDAQSVYSIAVKKFYVSAEYADVVKRQLPATSTVRIIASNCEQDMDGGPDTQTKFYEVGMEDHRLFLEAYIDDGEGSRGPGYTTFLFTKAKPDKRIKELQCKEL